MEKITPINVSKVFSPDVVEDLFTYVKEQVEYLYTTWQPYVSQTIPEARRLYKGIPADEHRDFPWENASNLVIQVIGTAVDNLTARVIGSLWQLMPLFNISVVGEWGTEVDADKYKGALEEMLSAFAIDPAILDLYRKEQLWFSDAIKYGTKVMKVAFDSCVEANVLSADSVVDALVYQGPRPENIEPEDFATYPSFDKLEHSPFKYHRVRLTKQQLQERVHTHDYDSELVEELLGQPDDLGSSAQEVAANADADLASTNASVASHYYLYECWFPYFLNGRKYRLIVTWSRRLNKALRSIFNFYADNMEPFEVARLGYRTSEFQGYGLAEMLKYYQEEVSAIHNKRQDNMTVANIQGIRVSPRNTNIDSNFKLAPGVIFPAEAGEIEPIMFGANYRSTQDDEQLVLKEVSDRSGVSPAVSGLGGGTVNKKGTYSSQGTFAEMQAGNSRSDLDIMDMRYAHLGLGRKLMRIYAQFGVMKDHLGIFGLNADVIKQGLQYMEQKKLMINANAATASINRELERQNSILLSTQLQRQQQANSQMMQAITNPQVPPEIKQYLTEAMSANTLMMKRILRSFNFEDVSRYVPEFKPQAAPAQNGGQAINAQNQQPQLPNAARLSAVPTGPPPTAGAIPVQGMGGVPSNAS